MTPRPYRQGVRRETTDRTQARIRRAARDLLLRPRLGAEFSLEAVARRAKVTRRTVYLRFGSRRALIEAAFDAMAEQGGIEEIGETFTLRDPREGLQRAVAVFGQFWTRGRVGIRRIRGLAEFDAELAEAVGERNERRREVFRTLVARLPAGEGRPTAGRLEEVVGLLFAVTSFEMFDLLAGPKRKPEAVTAQVQGLVERILENG